MQPTREFNKLPVDADRQDPAATRPLPSLSQTGTAALAAPPATPPQIEGYEVHELLGRGGMGTVWRAVQLGTKQQVAVKVMSQATLWSLQARQRFAREVELAARLDHPNIARVYNSGLHDGQYYYVMQFVAGVHLDDPLIRAQPRRWLLGLMHSVCQAVQHAHQSGVIHRDLKPSNVMISDDDRPYVLDFGLAKVVEKEPPAQQVSMTGEAPGTLHFMSPEQAEGVVNHLDTRTDVYSLGVILYRLLLDRLPHEREGSEYEIRGRIVEGRIARPRDVDQSIDADLEAILLKALALSPNDRYATAGELAADLQRYLDGDPILAQRLTAVYLLKKWIRKHRFRVAAAVAAALAIAALIVTSFLRERDLRTAAEDARQIAQDQKTLAQQQAETSRRLLYFNRIALANERVTANNTAAALELLLECPKDLRRWEWQYLWGLVDQSVATLSGHEQTLLAVGFADNGQQIISVDPRITLINDVSPRADPNRPFGPIIEKHETFETAALSVDGRYLVAAQAKRVVVWDTQSRQPTLEIPIEARLVAVGSTSPCVATITYPNIARFWDPVTGMGVELVAKEVSTIRALAVSPDGSRVAIGGQQGVAQANQSSGPNGIVVVFDTTTRSKLWSARCKSIVQTLVFSPDGARLASGGRSQLTLWTADKGRVIADKPVDALGVTLGPPGIGVIGSDGAVGLWALAPPPPTSSPGNDRPSPALRQLFHGRGHTKLPTCIAVAPNGRTMISGGADRKVLLWDVNPTQDELFRGKKALAVAPTGQRIAISDADGKLSIWDVHAGRPLRDLNVEESDVGWIGSDRTGQRWVVVQGQSEKSVQVYGLASPSPLAATRARASVVALSPDGATLAIGSENGVTLWGVSPFEQKRTLKGHDGPVRAVAFAPDGVHLVTAGDDAALRIWDRSSGELLNTLRGHGTSVVSVDFSPDGRRLLSTDLNGTVKLWDPISASLITTLCDDPQLRQQIFSPDGRLVALGSFGATRIFNCDSGDLVHQLVSREGTVTALAFTPDSSRLVSGGNHGSLRVWDTDSGSEVLTLPDNNEKMRSLCFSSNGRTLIAIASNGNATFFGVSQDQE